MEEYTNLEDEYEQYQGGFVWDYVDQAIEKDGKYYYGQDFDDYPNDSNFCGDGILLANRQETGKSQELKQLYRYVDMEIHFDSVTIKNKNLFYDLSKDTFIFELKRNGLAIQSGIFKTSVEPGTTKTMPVQFKQINTPGYYTKTIYYKTPLGIQAFDQQVFEVKQDQPKESAMLVVEGQNTIGIQFMDTEYLFDKRKGLVSILVNDTELLQEAPKPVFYRALTDNDCGAKQTYANWLNASLFQNVIDFKMIRNSKCTQMIYTIQLESIEEECKLVYTVYNNQSIQIQLHLDKNSKRQTLPLFGIDKKSNRQLKRANRKMSEYGLQLREKQKAKFIYGVLEKPFLNYFKKASKMNGMTGENLMVLLESRLDNVVFRLGLARTRREARQIVDHKHVLVNGKQINIPSYLVKAGDVVEIKETKKNSPRYKEIVEVTGGRLVPEWLEADLEGLKGTVKELPKREAIDVPVDEMLIVELYSK